MGRDVLSVKLDIIFKKFFTENTDMLQDFIASILEIPLERVKNIKISNTELAPESASAKFSRLDLSMTVDDTLVNVEVQVNNDPNYIDRSMFYWSKLFTSELKSGEEYGALKTAITINILDFVLFPDRQSYHAEIVSRFKDTNELFSDKFHIHFFELKKLSKSFDVKNRKELWLHFINADSKEEFDMIAGTNDKVMENAVNIIYDMSEDTRIRENARIREKALHDEASQMKSAEARGLAKGRAEGETIGIAKGIAQGRAEGKAEATAEILKQMRLFGMSEEEIKRFEESLKS